MIRCDDYTDANRIDAATLPPFANENRCATCGALWLVRVHYCSGCERIGGPHYHRFCPCGATWDEGTMRD